MTDPSWTACSNKKKLGWFKPLGLTPGAVKDGNKGMNSGDNTSDNPSVYYNKKAKKNRFYDKNLYQLDCDARISQP